MSSNTFPVTGPLEVSCRFGHGALTVRLSDELSEARVEVTPREADSDVDARFSVELRGDKLLVEGPKPSRGLFDLSIFTGKYSSRETVDVEIVVPTGSSLKLGTFAGQISTYGRSGSVEIGTGATTIKLDQIDGDLKLRYGAGPSQVHRVSGSAQLKAGSGDLTIAEIDGDLDAAFGSGSLDLGTARGAIKLRAGTGSTTVARAQADIDVVTGSGDLTVGLLTGYQARLDVVTGAGRLHTEMPVEQEPGKALGSLTIRARTGSGDVLIRHASQPDTAAS
ncbi:MAG TPA: DUF4097 family beta strand repeat-containing protein [Jatrophihabitans sp.]|jgi:hypothetical protein